MSSGLLRDPDRTFPLIVDDIELEMILFSFLIYMIEERFQLLSLSSTYRQLFYFHF